MTALSPRGAQLLAALRTNLQLIAEHGKHAPHEVELMYAALVSHIRSTGRVALLTGGGL